MNTTALHACCDDARAVPVQALKFNPSSLSGWLRRVVAVHRQRRRLARLTDRQLRDIGLRREDARREASRSFWDLP